VKRREFMTLVGGATAWPLAARAQQGEQVRRIGMLFGQTPNDPAVLPRIAAFRQALQQWGWTEGRNLRIDTRWSSDNADDTRKYAAELVGFVPDVILSSGTIAAVAVQQATRTVPIVFTLVGDPVGGGIVDSLARPGGNATGFMTYEYSLSGKWPELLKEIAPSVKRAGSPSRPLIHWGGPIRRDPESSAVVRDGG